MPVKVDVSTPPPAYNLLHFSADFQFKVCKNSLATLGFSVFNLMDTKYRDYLNRQRYFVDEMGRNLQLQLKLNY